MNLKKYYTLTALCLGFFMVIMDASIINVALPKIASSLQANLSSLQWVVAGYTLTFACCLLFAGYLADQLGAKKILLLGLIFFSLASLACGLATHINFLIIFRLAQGVTAATLIPASLTLINENYQDKKARAKAIGIWGGVGGIAAASGPIAGGILISLLGWPTIFFVNIPIGLIAIGLLSYHIKETKPEYKSRFDSLGQLLSFLTISSFAFALIEAGRFGWQSNIVTISIIIFLISLSLFIFTEKRTPFPMLPLELFKSKNFSIAIIAGCLLNTGIYGELFCLPLYFHQVRHYSILMTSFAIFPLLALVAIASYLAGKVTSHFGPRLPMASGFIIAMLGFCLLLITCFYSLTYYWLILPLALIGFGVAFTMPAATLIAIHAVSKSYVGIASGIFTTGRQLGSLFGVAIFGSILASTTHFFTGFYITLLIASLLFLLGFLLTLFTSAN